jgi:hypothetical protein
VALWFGDQRHGRRCVAWVGLWTLTLGIAQRACLERGPGRASSAHKRWDEQDDCHNLHAGNRCQSAAGSTVLLRERTQMGGLCVCVCVCAVAAGVLF